MLDILLVDDEAAIVAPIEEELRNLGHKVTVAFDGAEAMRRIESSTFDIVITDVRLPKVDGLRIFRRVRSETPATDVILMTAYGTISDAVDAIKDQARYYFAKPFDLEELLGAVSRIEQRRRSQTDMERARQQVDDSDPGVPLIGESAAMRLLRQRIDAIAAADGPVLITGESGTGKELVARRIHERGPRRGRPFVAVNCAAFPETLIETELFGHERGAFTGAIQKRDGRFKAADGGTMMLDEISEMPLAVQAKLLRVLQEGCFEPVGSNRSVSFDVRILSASNRDLKQLVADGKFREDLYYRVKLFHLEVAPLRSRRRDIPLLVEYFSRPAGNIELSPRAWAILHQHRFPGNVRELKHAVEHALVLAQGGRIKPEHLPDELRGQAAEPFEEGADVPTLSTAVKEFEREYLLRVIKLAGGSRTRAAQMLGISRKALWSKLREYDMSDVEPEA